MRGMKGQPKSGRQVWINQCKTGGLVSFQKLECHTCFCHAACSHGMSRRGVVCVQVLVL